MATGSCRRLEMRSARVAMREAAVVPDPESYATRRDLCGCCCCGGCCCCCCHVNADDEDAATMEVAKLLLLLPLVADIGG